MPTITPQLLQDLSIKLHTAYNKGLASVENADDYKVYSLEIESTTATGVYPDFSAVPSLKKWIGEKEVHNLSTSKYVLPNEEYTTGSVVIRRSDIEDDTVGVQAALIEGFAAQAANFMNSIVKTALMAGDTTVGPDGAIYFSADHAGPNGTKQSNIIDGTGEKWFLVDASKIVKPFIAQLRKAPHLETLLGGSDTAYNTGNYSYSVDARGAAGYGYWATALQSRKELTAENVWDAYTTMRKYVNDKGSSLGIKPTHLIVYDPAQEAAALRLFSTQFEPGGGSNPLYGRFKVLVLS